MKENGFVMDLIGLVLGIAGMMMLAMGANLGWTIMVTFFGLMFCLYSEE